MLELMAFHEQTRVKSKKMTGNKEHFLPSFRNITHVTTFFITLLSLLLQSSQRYCKHHAVLVLQIRSFSIRV